ncbi:MAG: GGDEF domain-containing protein, partial [Burkholderiales bacterium]|nr:GGDEF domain-containing protein [Burkholderiales bacterium]
TGLYPKGTNHQIDLAYIELRGKLINNNTLQLLLLLLWGGSAAFWLITELRRSIRALQRSNQRQQDLENAQLNLQKTNQLLAERSMRDPLTSVFNREGLSVLLANESPNSVLSIIFVDIDHFKKINDQYGHAMGDQMLCLLAQHIQQQIRPSEKLIRLGGEEFLLLCQHSCITQAELLAEKLRLWIFSQSWPTEIPLSCSFGVAERQPGESFEAALHRADLALYRAKAAGRNRVELAK